MKEKQNIEAFFRTHQSAFDVEELPDGHEARFLSRLEKGQTQAVGSAFVKKPFFFWASIAASVAILFGVFFAYQMGKTSTQLANVSSEMAKTQHFFVRTIQAQLRQVEKVKVPQAKVVVEDAMTQLKILETDYTRLTKDLRQSGENQKVIRAMIANFQKRVALLEQVLKQIEQLKKRTHEKATIS